jgi:RAB6A-GEF complex partner protein 1
VIDLLELMNLSAVPILDKEAYIVSMDYSPLLAGFSIVLKDGRAAFLTSSNLKFDPNVSIN